MKTIAQNTKTRNKASIPKMVSGIIVTISIVVVGFFSLPPFWFWTCLEIIAGGLVAAGCWGEWYLFKNPPVKGKESLHRRKELQCIIAVAIGVTMEFAALSHAIPEGARLERDVAEANERTSTNELHFAELNHSNLVLQSSLDETKTELANTQVKLEKIKRAIPPRQIPEKQRELFIATMLQTNALFSPKIDIKVLVQNGDDWEANNFAGAIRGMLNDAGYGTNQEDVIKIPPLNIVPNGPQNQRMPEIFAVFATDYDGRRIPLSMPSMGGCISTMFPTTNTVQSEIGNPKIPIVFYYSTNPNDILGGVRNILNYIGLTTTELNTTNVLKPYEVALYIPPQVE